jgi:hypothetical protein
MCSQFLDNSEISPYHPNRHLTNRLLLYNPSVFRGVAFALYHFFFPLHHFENNLRHKPAVDLLQSDDQHKDPLFLHLLIAFLLSF